MGREYQRRIEIASLINLPAEPILVENFDAGFDWDISGNAGDYGGELATDKQINGSGSRTGREWRRTRVSIFFRGWTPSPTKSA